MTLGECFKKLLTMGDLRYHASVNFNAKDLKLINLEVNTSIVSNNITYTGTFMTQDKDKVIITYEEMVASTDEKEAPKWH